MTDLHDLVIPQPIPPSLDLSDRELQVLTGMSYGHTNGQIGRKLGVSEDTVKTHNRSLFKKLGTNDRAHAVRVGLERGILSVSVPAGDLVSPTPRDVGYRDTHIAACFAAESCPCRYPLRQHAPSHQPQQWTTTRGGTPA